jgi:hypothetical protein
VIEMRDIWYADNRDLIKWGVLFRLAEKYEAVRILQVAYYRPSTFGQIELDEHQVTIPEEIIAHFRNVRAVSSIDSQIRVAVFDPVFQDRQTYLQAVLAFVPAYAGERCIIFLDPDTGLESRPPTLEHVLATEVNAIWGSMKSEDVLVFYQHQTNRAGQPWISQKHAQLAQAMGVPQASVKIASGEAIARDVVFFYMQKV